MSVLDLFAGAGGMALGFKAAGAQCIGAIELDQAAADSFARTFAADQPVVLGGPEAGDVNNVPVTTLLDNLPRLPDIVVGGPPCQGFSRIGRAKQASLLADDARVRHGGVSDPGRNLLYQYFLAVVREARPLAFVMENVPGMREHLGNDFARKIASEAHYIGYNVRYFLLDAANYGVPQRRSRLFFVGLRSDLGHDAIPEPPAQTHSGNSALLGSSLPDDHRLVAGPDLPRVRDPQPVVTVRDAIGDLPRLKGHLGPRGAPVVDVPMPLRGPPSPYVKRLRDWPSVETPKLVTGHWYRFTRRDFPIFEQMAQGDCYPQALEIAHRIFREELSRRPDRPVTGSPEWEAIKAEIVPPYRNDAFHDKWKKLVADEPSWTLTAHLSKDTYSHIHYDSRQARMITVREAARLQSFPDGIEFAGNFGEQFRQIGNAVPPLVARALAERLLGQLSALGSSHAKSA